MAVVTTDNDSATSSRRRAPAWRPLARSLTPAAAILAVQLVLFPLSAGLWLRGLIVGGLTALIALGMAITYRSNRIVNFAAGDLGTAPVVLVFLLISVWHWPYLVSALARARRRRRRRRRRRAGDHPPLLPRAPAAPHASRRSASRSCSPLSRSCCRGGSGRSGCCRRTWTHRSTSTSPWARVGSAVIFDGNALLALIVTPIVIALLALALRVRARSASRYGRAPTAPTARRCSVCR